MTVHPLPDRPATDGTLLSEPTPDPLRFDDASQTWVITSFDVALSVLTDRTFETAPPVTLPTTGMSEALQATVRRGLHLQSLWLGTDTAGHPRVRPVAAGALNPRSLAGIDGVLRDRAVALLDGAIASNQHDIVTAFVVPFVHGSAMDLFGLPAHSRAVAAACAVRLSGFIDGPPDAILRAAFAQACLGSVFDKLLAVPANASAVLMLAVQRAMHDGAITRDEAASLLSVLLFAGLHTTTRAVGALVGRLGSDPSIRAGLAAGSIQLEVLIEESLRFDGPHVPQPRIPARDVHVGDQLIAAGDCMRIDFHAANRDPSRFPDPHTFDASRHDGDHLTFSAGLHRCVGRHFARMQLKAAGEAFADAYPRLPGPCRDALAICVPGVLTLGGDTG